MSDWSRVWKRRCGGFSDMAYAYQETLPLVLACPALRAVTAWRRRDEGRPNASPLWLQARVEQRADGKEAKRLTRKRLTGTALLPPLCLCRRTARKRLRGRLWD